MKLEYESRSSRAHVTEAGLCLDVGNSGTHSSEERIILVKNTLQATPFRKDEW